jgi:excisionase family DNA binding protein
MNELEQAEQDRLKAENTYLLSRLVEMETRLNTNLDKPAGAVDRLSKLVIPAHVPRLLTPEQVADMLAVKPGAVYKWVSEGSIPYRRAGSKPRFLLHEILAWTAPDQAEKRSAGDRRVRNVVGLPRQS